MVNRRDMVLGLFLLVVLLGVISIALLMSTAFGTGGFRVSGDCVAIIEINGPIYDPMPVVQRLERYIKSDDVLAIVVRLNTPGGGISATQEIHDTILKARYAGKTVIASMGTVAASGGYYIAAACDSVVATPGTITGSIGVIAKFSEFSELFEKIGITFNTRKSGKFKDTGSVTRKMTKEEEALIDEVIMDTYEQFVEAVSEGRNLDPDYVRKYADGRVFTGRQAKKLGFVDMLGTYQDAIDLAGDMVGLGIDPPVLRERRGFLYDVLIDGVSRIVTGGIDFATPRIAYMWSD